MFSNIGEWRRSVYCGEVSTDHIGREVTLMGWIQRRRDHGGLIFIDLRDREGIVQLVFNPERSKDVHERAHCLRNEYVIAVKGTVAKRPEGTENPSIRTGDVEVIVKEFRILNDSLQTPFVIEDRVEVTENLRLKYRYLDLRRTALQKNLILRHRVSMAVREFLSREGFIEIETPFLTKSTPEGARDFLVPSRLNPGTFYALPQSPQIFKQILMIAGFDRYFQIVKCFRDEDLRADRQPEFTQIDLEMSFVERDDVMGIVEGLLYHIFRTAVGIDLTLPFPRLTHSEAMERYGLDAPDTRFGLELRDVTGIVRGSAFKVFSDTIAKGGIVKAINAKGCGGFSRKDLDELTEYAKTFGAKGLAWIRILPEEWQSPIAKFLSDEEKRGLTEVLKPEPGDLILFSADDAKTANTVLGRIRLKIAERLDLIPKGGFEFVWVTDFPLLEYDEGEGRFKSVHHPFTSPMDEDVEKLATSPLEVRSKAYDIVLNGEEIGGGSIRIHRSDIQEDIFRRLGISDEEASRRFGFLLEALRYGTPPHGGIALGLDRLVAIIAGAESIRDVIAFPKTQKAVCLMSDAPSAVDTKQLDELSIKVIKRT